MEMHTYASSGVDINKAEGFVERLKRSSQRLKHDALWKASGGYAAVVPVSNDLAIACTTDGVGTKLLVAAQLGKLETIGIDLVAMCANDLICVGAAPTGFLDYYATPKLDDTQADAIIKGIVEGCDQSDMPLVGGETAELPGLYADQHFDLAGFAIGTVTREQLITGDAIRPGDTVIGIASSGIHSNGFSLARKIIPAESELYAQLLIPTHLYVKPAVDLLSTAKQRIHGLAHITGGGWRNMFRLNKEVGFEISDPLPLPPILQEIAKKVDASEMYKTFNMGVGLIVISPNAEVVTEVFGKHGFEAKIIGQVTAQAGRMQINAGPHALGVSKVTLES